MKIVPSVCSNLYFPKSRASLAAFREMASFLAERGVRSLEFYHDGDGANRVGAALSDFGLEGIYIAVIPLKEGLLHLCDRDESGRERAMALLRRSADIAADNGMGCVMFNSGRVEYGREEEQLEALFRSVSEIFDYAARRGYKLGFEMEPCDSAMDARQLIGPSRRTRALMERLTGAGIPLRLTMDSAHTAEEGEDFYQAVAALKPWCDHVHYANCRVSDPSDPLYGDKHLGYEYPDSVWTFEALDELTARLDALYAGDEPLRVGLEALCREDDPYAWFDRTWRRLRRISSEGEDGN